MSRTRPPTALGKARNSFRPFFNSKKNRPFWKQMQALRQEALPNEYADICRVAEDNPAYPFPGLGNTFPASQREVPSNTFRLLKALSGPREIELQVARLNHHRVKLQAALESLARINGHLVCNALDQAEEAIALHKEAYGLSLVLTKKELLLALERNSLAGLFTRYKVLTKGTERTGWALLCHFYYDLMDPTFDPSRAIRLWLGLTERRMDVIEWVTRLIEDELLTQSRNTSTLASAFLRYSATSLLDLALLLWRKRAVHPRDQKLQSAFTRLDASLAAILTDKFSHLQIRVSNSYRLTKQSPTDIEIYRTSFLFDDIAYLRYFRIASHYRNNIFVSRLGYVPADLRAFGAWWRRLASGPRRARGTQTCPTT